jgi:signal transduction histidine kinase/CheY-like chemotaxis protein
MWSTAAIAIGSIVAAHAVEIFAQAPLLLLWVILFSLADYFEVAIEAGDGNPALMTVTDAVIIFLVAVAGVLGILVVAAGTLIVDSIRQRAWFRVLFNVAARSVAFGLIWLIYSLLSTPGGLPFNGWLGLVTFAAVATVDYVTGVFFVSTIIALASQQPLLHIYREAYRRVSWVYLVTTPAGAVLAILWAIDPWMLVLGIVPLVMAQRSYKALSAWQEENRRNKALAQESRQLAGKLERLQDTTTAMMASLDPLPLLETVSLRLAAMMDAPASWVVLLDAAAPRLVVANDIPANFGWDAQAYIDELQSHHVRQLNGDEIARLHMASDAGWQSGVMIPLMLEQRVLGVICLASAQPIALAEDDRRVLVAFAGQAALAMERARLFAELRDKQAELVRSSKLAALGTFSAGIAHEFNNLLAGILGHAELGLMSDDMAEKDDALNVAVRTSLRGKSITRGLLTFARRNDPQREMNQIRDAIEDTLVLVERELGKLNIQVERRFEPVPLTICDLGQISQVLLNLITNARDAMVDQGGGVITVELRQRDRQIELSVSDTGSGIAPELLDQVFQPFVTTKGALGGSTTPGTGLGLAISYGIVESHGGTITASSELGCGTTMTVRLPITNPLGTDMTLEAASQPLMPMRILVVADEQSVAVSLGRLLAERGHEVSTAADGSTGLRLYRQQAFDLVITDVIMPGMSGATFVERLRLYDANARVLVMTGQPGEPQVEQMLRLGALGVVAKPFELEELLATIARSAYGRAVAV